jgi:hypothetical protein
LHPTAGGEKNYSTLKKKIQAKNNRPTFLFSLRVKRHARRLWTCHRMLSLAAGCAAFHYELVPSDDPFIWCLCETICFPAILFFSAISFFL